MGNLNLINQKYFHLVNQNIKILSIQLKKDSMHSNKSIKYPSFNESWEDQGVYNLNTLNKNKIKENKDTFVNNPIRKIKSTNLFIQKQNDTINQGLLNNSNKPKKLKQAFTSYFDLFPKSKDDKKVKKLRPFEQVANIKQIDSFDEEEVNFPKEVINKLAIDEPSDSNESSEVETFRIETNQNMTVNSQKVSSLKQNSYKVKKISKCQSNQINFLQKVQKKDKDQKMSLYDIGKYILNKKPIPQPNNPQKITDVKKIKLNYDKAVFSFMVWSKKDIAIGIKSFSNFSLQVSIRLSYFYHKAKSTLKKIYNIKNQRQTIGKRSSNR
jgi:hypothetical protein